MPLNWSNLPQSRLCVVTGDGAVTRADIDAYLAGTIREGVKSYAKLVDIMTCTLALSADDLEHVADSLVQYGWGDRAGPVAMVVGTPLNLDMAVLLKQRVGERPFRIFTNQGAAREWLASYAESYDLGVLPAGTTGRGRGLRPS